MSDFKMKMHQIVCRLGLRPRPSWRILQRSPRPSIWILGGGEGTRGEGREGRGGKGKGGGEGQGRGESERGGRVGLQAKAWPPELFS